MVSQVNTALTGAQQQSSLGVLTPFEGAQTLRKVTGIIPRNLWDGLVVAGTGAVLYKGVQVLSQEGETISTRISLFFSTGGMSVITPNCF